MVPEDLWACYPDGYYTHGGAPGRATEAKKVWAEDFKGRVRRSLIAAIQGRSVPRNVAGLIGWALSRTRRGRERILYLIEELTPRRSAGLRALDVGCGGGSLMALLHRVGWDVEGVEWDQRAAAHARQVSGRTVVEGDFRHVELPRGMYDLVILNHVFEHLDDPLGSLHRIKDLLKPGGRAVLLYPNPDALGARVFGRDWFNWDPPRHLVLPPVGACRRAAKKIGFRRTVATTSARGAAHHLARSRAYSTGDGPEEWHRLRIGLQDRLAAGLECVLTGVGFAVGEEAVVVLHK